MLTSLTNTPEQFAAAQRAGIEATIGLSHAALANTERLVAFNVAVFKTFLEDSANNVKALLGAKDVQDIVSFQAAVAQPSAEKALAYSRGIYEIASQAQAEVAKVVESQVAELNRTVIASLDKAVKASPPGSEFAINSVKSAIAAANSAFESVARVGKQMAEMAEANVEAASAATSKVVNGSRKKAA